MVCYAPLLSVHWSSCAENCFCATTAVSLSCVVGFKTAHRSCTWWKQSFPGALHRAGGSQLPNTGPDAVGLDVAVELQSPTPTQVP